MSNDNAGSAGAPGAKGQSGTVETHQFEMTIVGTKESIQGALDLITGTISNAHLVGTCKTSVQITPKE